jgi:hypothetical protein
MLFVTLIKQKYLLNNQIVNNFKKNLYNKVNTMYKNEVDYGYNNKYENKYVNEYINKKQLKITNATCCKYCKGTGWIIWKTKNNLYEVKTSKSLVPVFSYSLCYKCNNL